MRNGRLSSFYLKELFSLINVLHLSVDDSVDEDLESLGSVELSHHLQVVHIPADPWRLTEVGVFFKLSGARPGRGRALPLAHGPECGRGLEGVSSTGESCLLCEDPEMRG